MAPAIKLNAVQVLGVAALGVVLGGWLKRRIPLLDRLNIPVSIAGGMIYAVIALICRDRLFNLDTDVSLRDLLQVAFMTTIGLGARLELVRRGGARLLWF